MKELFKNVVSWFHKHLLTICFFSALILFSYSVISLLDVTRKPAPLDEADGVQHHLVWDINGKCFFVKPHSRYTNYLVAVSDCDKK